MWNAIDDSEYGINAVIEIENLIDNVEIEAG